MGSLMIQQFGRIPFHENNRLLITQPWPSTKIILRQKYNDLPFQIFIKPKSFRLDFLYNTMCAEY